MMIIISIISALVVDGALVAKVINKHFARFLLILTFVSFDT